MSIDTLENKKLQFDPLLMAIHPNGTPLTSEESVAMWLNLSTVSEETYQVLYSSLVADTMTRMHDTLQLTDDVTMRIAALIRVLYFEKVTLEQLPALLKDEVGISQEKVAVTMNFIRTEILTLKSQNIPQEAVAEEVSQIKTTTLILLAALSQYPRINDQPLTSNRLQVRNEKEQVRGSVRNWLRAYRDVVGARKHTAIERGQFLFHSENTKNLVSAERDRLALVLKSLDDNEILTIDIDKQEIVFPRVIIPQVAPVKASVPPVAPVVPKPTPAITPVVAPLQQTPLTPTVKQVTPLQTVQPTPTPVVAQVKPAPVMPVAPQIKPVLTPTPVSVVAKTPVAPSSLLHEMKATPPTPVAPVTPVAKTPAPVAPVATPPMPTMQKPAATPAPAPMKRITPMSTFNFSRSSAPTPSHALPSSPAKMMPQQPIQLPATPQKIAPSAPVISSASSAPMAAPSRMAVALPKFNFSRPTVNAVAPTSNLSPQKSPAAVSTPSAPKDPFQFSSGQVLPAEKQGVAPKPMQEQIHVTATPLPKPVLSSQKKEVWKISSELDESLDA